MARIKNITAEEVLNDPAFMQDLQDNYICITSVPSFYWVAPKTLHNLKCNNKISGIIKFRNKLYFKREQLELLFTPKNHNNV